LSPTFRALSPDAVTQLLVDRIADRPGLVRVAVDGPPSAAPHTMADSLVEPLHARGRAAHLVRAETFWRDASLRLEYGHEDPDSYRTWLDAAALRREVLDRAATDHTYLPSLRDPSTNRATRAQPRELAADAVVIVSGALLLGLGLPFELTVHLAVSPAARARRTPAEQAWTLPAFDRYDDEVRPVEQADVVVRLNDPRHPAVASR
jgi:hypothetical protein